MVLRLFLGLWSLLWTAGLPVILAYLYRRGRKDPDYVRNLPERFGRYNAQVEGAIWVHAVSLGEFRSAVPLIKEMLNDHRTVVCTLFTPAGRREAERVFSTEIAQGRFFAVWVPFETAWAYRGFFRAFQPVCGLVMEIEIWPRMVFAARRAGVPLFMCNAQYPRKSIARDSQGLRLRQRVMQGFAGAFVKSQIQADRFASIGVKNISVTGELRFDQPVPPHLIERGGQARNFLGAAQRRVITIASAIEGEDATYIHAISSLRAHHLKQGMPMPLIVYVPRRPERFDEVAEQIAASGLSLKRRSIVFDPSLVGLEKIETPDVLLGDSLGEMYFYLAMSDQVIVGGGFNPKGAHNIIEPLALKKPVMTGPHTGTIEFPFVEAEAAGVALSVPDAGALADALIKGFAPTPDMIDAFFAKNSGAAKRTLAALYRQIKPLQDRR